MRTALLLLLSCLVLVAAPPAPSLAAAGLDDDVDPAGTAVWPLHPEPEVVNGFDPPTDPYGSGHRGVDLAGRPGQQVRTALAGTITYAGRLAGRGVVVVSHGATRTTYEPVTARVSVGDAVRAGNPIGVLELPGSHCFPAACLHWGWLRGEVYLDPLELVGRKKVRLLPLFVSTIAPGARSAWPWPISAVSVRPAGHPPG